MNVIVGEVDNGKRVEVRLGFYDGEAGLRERGDVLELAFPGDPPRSFQEQDGEVGGVPVRVVSVAFSPFAKGMTFATARRITEA